jgi:5'-AMP-activated protein kinase regulatory gamma subunit
MVVSVITQYRILKFIAVNVKETQNLRKSLKDLKTVGTFDNLQSASMDTPVIDVIHKLVKYNISSVPMLDKHGECVDLPTAVLTAPGVLINVFESVDVITLISGGVYEDLNMTVGEVLLKRPDDFAGIHTCSPTDRLDAIFDTLRKSRVHRFIVVDHRGRLNGVLTLSDILQYILIDGPTEAELRRREA